MPDVTISYFDARARVEPIRVMLEELAIPYHDQRISFEDWTRMKGDTPFGALPSYRDGELEIFQTHAIIRHLARVHGLYGSSEADRVRCDVIEEALSDLNELVGKAPSRSDFSNQRGVFVSSELAPMLSGLERFLKSNLDPSGFWIGSSMTFIDLVAYAVFDSTRLMFPEAISVCPTLRDACDRIANRPRVRAYLNSDRRPAVIQFGPTGAIYDHRF